MPYGILLYSLLQHVSASLKSHHQVKEDYLIRRIKIFLFRAVEISTFAAIRCFRGRNKDNIEYIKIIKTPYFSCERFASAMLNGPRGGNYGIKNLF
jgi:hypothetical protein